MIAVVFLIIYDIVMIVNFVMKKKELGGDGPQPNADAQEVWKIVHFIFIVLCIFDSLVNGKRSFDTNIIQLSIDFISIFVLFQLFIFTSGVFFSPCTKNSNASASIVKTTRMRFKLTYPIKYYLDRTKF